MRRECGATCHRYHVIAMAGGTEEQLAACVVRWLAAQRWDVYQEVKATWRGDIADIVATRGPLVWVIECKKSCSLTVIAQAHRWKSLMRSIAIPRASTRRHQRDPQRQFAFEVCQRFQIGVVEIGRANQVYETIRAPILRHHRKSSRHIRARLHPAQRTFLPAGSQSGARWTPYRQTLDAVRSIVREHPGCTLSFIMESLTDHHYASDPAARNSLGQALREWETWCVVDESRLPHRYYLEGAQPAGVEKMLYRYVATSTTRTTEAGAARTDPAGNDQ